MFNLTFLPVFRTMVTESKKGVQTMAAPVTYDRNLFADNLQRLMKQHREKQVDIANLLGVSKSTVSAYCSGSQMPRMDKIEQLALHFGVTRGFLLGETAQPAVPAPQPEEPEAPTGAIWCSSLPTRRRRSRRSS